MKGYKGFNKGLICRNKQYAENTVFEEKEANIYENGMHFCKSPFDVLGYYPIFDDNGQYNEFAEVEALDEIKTADNKKFCTKKLKIGGKINFTDFVNFGIEYIKEETMKEFDINNDGDDDYAHISSSEYFAKIGNSGCYAHISSSGNGAKIGNSGYYVKIGSSSDDAHIGNSGNGAKIVSSGDLAKIGSSGCSAKIGSSGDFVQIGSSGCSTQIGSSGWYAQIVSSGCSAKISSSGNSAQIGSSGNSVQIGSSGDYTQIRSSGNSAQIGSSGDYAQINSSGDDSVILCAGMDSSAKAKKGSWITLTEWEYSEEKGRYIPICVKTEQVDGVKIKEDTFYILNNGQFEEVKELKEGE